MTQFDPPRLTATRNEYRTTPDLTPLAFTPQKVASARNRGCTPGKLYTQGRKGVVLTFDDGPSPQTNKLLRTLKKFDAPATFFVLGVQVKQHPQIVRRAAQQGHIIANHTQTHSYNPYTIAREMPYTSKLIRRVAGTLPAYFRAPGLTQSSIINTAVRKHRMCNITTDYDVGDWNAPRISSAAVCQRVLHSTHRGSIVLLHDGIDHRQTIDAVPCIVKGLQKRGLNIVSLPESVGEPN